MDYGLLWIVDYYYGLLLCIYQLLLCIYGLLMIINDYNLYIYCVLRCIQALSSMKSNSGASFSILWPSNLASCDPPPAEPRGMLSMMITSGEMDSCDSAK